MPPSALLGYFLIQGNLCRTGIFPLAAAAKSAGSVKFVNPDGSIFSSGPTKIQL